MGIDRQGLAGIKAKAKEKTMEATEKKSPAKKTEATAESKLELLKISKATRRGDSEVVSIRLNRDILERMDKMADAHGFDGYGGRAALIRFLIHNGLETFKF